MVMYGRPETGQDLMYVAGIVLAVLRESTTDGNIIKR